MTSHCALLILVDPERREVNWAEWSPGPGRQVTELSGPGATHCQEGLPVNRALCPVSKCAKPSPSREPAWVSTCIDLLPAAVCDGTQGFLPASTWGGLWAHTRCAGKRFSSNSEVSNCTFSDLHPGSHPKLVAI